MEFISEKFGKLRVVQKDGANWFVACDVARALGIRNVKTSLDQRVRDEDRSYVLSGEWNGVAKTSILNAVNENGLKTLVRGSIKRGRDEYAKWLNDEVLPAVYNTGVPAVVQTNTITDCVEVPMVFHNEKFGDLRTSDNNGELWFVASDVCRALDIKNSRDAVSSLDEDEKMTVALTDSHSGSRGGAQFQTYVSEAGFYTLTLRSRKAEAKPFIRWVTHDVIPSIRKHGIYAIQQIANDPVELLRKAADLIEDQRSRLKDERMKNAELVSRLTTAEQNLITANSDVTRWKEQYLRLEDNTSKKEKEIALLHKQIEAYHSEHSHRKEFTAFINSCVRSFVGTNHDYYTMPSGWTEFYRRLSGVIGEDVRKRGTQPYINAITNEELPAAMKIAAEMGTHELVTRMMSDAIREAMAA